VRVLVLCDFFLKYALAQACGLREAGADVALVCRSHALEFGGDQVERAASIATARDRGIAIFELPGRVTAAAAWPAAWRVRRAVREWRPDIVHAHDNYDPRLFAVSRGYATVLTVHDVERHPGAPTLRRIERRVRIMWLKRASSIVVHGDALKAKMAAVIPDKQLVVLPHGAETRKTALCVPSDRVILLLGRLEPYKGVAVLLQAMRLVWDARDDVRLIVAGAGPESALIPDDERIEAHLRYIPESELPDFLARASLVVLPYTEGSQSGVGPLAAGSGVPAVVSDAGSLPDLVVDASYVAVAGDSDSLASVLLEHLDDGPDARSQVLAMAREQLDWRIVGRRSIEIYRRVLREEVR
jgi:alpha-maltose-1-phosphate synthase